MTGIMKINTFLRDCDGSSPSAKRAEENCANFPAPSNKARFSVVITDADGKIEYVNAKFSEVTGYAIHEESSDARLLQWG